MNHNLKKHKYLFIVGAGRSGTSLLQSMLASHPNVIMLPETHFVRNYLIKYKSIDRQTRIKLLSDKYLKRLSISPMLPELIDKSKTPIELYTNIFQYLKYSDDVIIYGDKDPRNIDYITDIKSMIDNSIFIHIIRDPRDVVLSRTKANWSKSSPFFLHATIYNIHVSRGKAQGNLLGTNRYYEIYYEDLLSNPMTQINSLCEFMDLKYDPDMISNFSNAAANLVSGKEMQWKKETLGPLLKNNFNKWKNELSNFQIIIIESICKDSFKDGKYMINESSNPLTIFQIVQLYIIILVSYLLKYIYGLRILLKK